VLNFHNSAADKRTENLENSLRVKDREFQDLRQSHGSLADEVMRLSDEKIKLSDELAKLSDELMKLADEINAREAALAHAEDRISVLAKLFVQLEAKAHRSGKKDIAGIAGIGNLEASGCLGAAVGAAVGANGKPGDCAVLKRDLDSDAWLFGGGKAARLS
jgi:predicted RNase H-like nuclease (RuvC/YqgF family)